jgi:hypothetical protein
LQSLCSRARSCALGASLLLHPALHIPPSPQISRVRAALPPPPRPPAGAVLALVLLSSALVALLVEGRSSWRGWGGAPATSKLLLAIPPQAPAAPSPAAAGAGANASSSNDTRSGSGDSGSGGGGGDSSQGSADGAGAAAAGDEPSCAPFLRVRDLGGGNECLFSYRPSERRGPGSEGATPQEEPACVRRAADGSTAAAQPCGFNSSALRCAVPAAMQVGVAGRLLTDCSNTWPPVVAPSLPMPPCSPLIFPLLGPHASAAYRLGTDADPSTEGGTLGLRTGPTSHPPCLPACHPPGRRSTWTRPLAAPATPRGWPSRARRWAGACSPCWARARRRRCKRSSSKRRRALRRPWRGASSPLFRALGARHS